MEFRRKFLPMIVAVGVAAVGIATATPASAQVYRSSSCGGSVEIQKAGQGVQCFTWNGVKSTGYVLNVGDWYGWVDAGEYNITTNWHDQATGANYTISPGVWGKAGQPTSNSILVNIVFNS
ncbi:hypothetical protein [Streptacidiphilus albus]|jgi:hypothetical protein|uniref:hypothetical protein n=1 Tax=Streptacidiphilus albus TaxID=105425 RepID=UPI00054B3AF3|nr:hypothetical protein [Streptacidiphilus albus]